MKQKKHTESGFTLVELLVAMAISGLVLTGIYQTFLLQSQHYNLNRQLVAMEQNLRAGMQFLESEIRMAGFDPSDKADAGVMTAGTNTIRITMDLNMDGDLEDEDEDVTYRIYTATDGIQKLGRQIPTSGGGSITHAVCEYVSALEFEYLDAGNAVIADPSTNLDDIRAVRIKLTAQTVSTRPIRFGELETLIRCRNLGI